MEKIVVTTKEEAKELILNWHKQNNREPVIKDFRNDPGLPHDYTLKKLFHTGSISEIKKAIGISPVQSTFTEEIQQEIIQHLKEYSKIKGSNKFSCASFSKWLKEEKNLSCNFWKYKDKQGNTMHWNIWLEKAGLNITKGSYSKEDVNPVLLEIVRGFKEKNRRMPSQKEIQEHLPSPLNISTITRINQKSLGQLLEEHGFYVNKKGHSKEELKEILLRFRNEVSGRTPLLKEFQGKDRLKKFRDGRKIPNGDVFLQTFGTFKEALNYAGLR